MGAYKDIAIAKGLSFDPARMARRSDPVSSKLAAEHMIESGKLGDQAQHVIDIVRLHPHCTAFELTDYSHLDRYQIQRRLSDLARDDEKTGFKAMVKHSSVPRKCAKSKRKAVTWSVI